MTVVKVIRHEDENGKPVWDVFINGDWHERLATRSQAREVARRVKGTLYEVLGVARVEGRA